MQKTNDEDRIRVLELRLDEQDREIQALVDLMGYFVLEQEVARENLIVN